MSTTYTRTVLTKEDVLAILASSLPLTPRQQKTLKIFVSADSNSVSDKTVAQALCPTRGNNGKFIFSKEAFGIARRSLNKVLGNAPGGVVRLYYTSPNATFFRLYRIIPKDDNLGEGSMEIRKISIAHGLANCRRFGCVIVDCKIDRTCHMARAYAAVGGNPEHQRITTPDEAYANSQK